MRKYSFFDLVMFLCLFSLEELRDSPCATVFLVQQLLAIADEI